MAEFEVVIRGGSIVDGTGVPRFTADLAICDGRIAEIGRVDANRAQRVLEADGLIVAPGAVDLHTHYDAQIQWDPWCTISGWHGVTTVVLGNCGFGFAPVRPADREVAMRTMARTEAIGLDAMRAGLLWDWETIPEWLDSLDRIRKGVNCLSYAPIIPILYWVMGVEAAKSRGPTEPEQVQIDRLINEAMDAGACGWSMQRMGLQTAQTDFDGTPMATDTMAEADVLALAEILGRRGEGFIQITQVSEWKLKDNLAAVERIADSAQRPVLFNVVQAVNDYPDLHRRYMSWLEDCHRRGLSVYGQGVTVRQPFHIMLEDWNLFDMAPTWNQSLQGSIEDKMRNLRDPERRRAMVSEYDDGIIPLSMLGGRVEDYVIECAPSAAGLDGLLGQRVGEVAQARGVHPVECLLDLSLQADLHATFLTRSASGDIPEDVAELLSSPYIMAGVSDGGAHAKFTVGGAYPTDMLEWLVREQGVISAELAHHKLAWLPARAAGLQDRGGLIEGMAADVVVYDPTRIKRAPDWKATEVVHDQPDGEWRRSQRAEGYHWTLVNGEVSFEGNHCTDVTPGRLLRQGAKSRAARRRP
ncbi:MAG: amidohydrolase family protein [Deltaproteobacteria bacterium]|nr:amidohydrolase family protein [Deltaproteobacteria bacterium]